MKPLAALALLAALLALALLLGDQPLPPAEVAAALVDPASVRPETAFITRELRLPRALLALLLGAGLGVAGAVTQALMRNPLAEPGLLGINGGAALAAILVMVWLPGLSAAWLPWAAFGGALAASGAIWALAWRQGARSGRIILMGIGLGALMGAASSFASAFGEITAVQRAMLWLAGSLQDSRWIKVQTLALWLAAPLALAWAGARALDLLAFDDAVAQGLGLRVQAARGLMILLCALVCGAAVAAAGGPGMPA